MIGTSRKSEVYTAGNRNELVKVQTAFRAGLSARLCLGLARLFLKTPLSRFGLRNQASGARFESYENYISDRVFNVESYRNLFSDFCQFDGKMVLELGCSRGYLLAGFLEFEHFSAMGVDIDAQALTLGRSAYGDRITFIQSTSSSIPLADESVDVIFTIDTVEHLSKPLDIFMECHRVLRPQGLFLVHFHPWLGPYGAHLDDIIPFPWPNVMFSMDTILTVAAHLYDSENYTPACYWFDPESGQRRPNPYLDQERWREYLNHMTVARFKRLVRALPFELIHFRTLGFGGKTFPLARWLSRLAQVPVLDELFSSAVFCVLRKRNT